MNRHVCLFALLALCVSYTASGQPAGVITNKDVISMVQAGVKEQIIENALNTSTIGFDVTPQALVALKTAHVRDSLIQLIVTLTAAKPASTRTQTTLNNADIITMVVGKLADATIIAAVQAADRRDFDVTPSGLVQLQTAHVSAKVMQAIQANMTTPHAGTAESKPDAGNSGNPTRAARPK